jgi:phosphatidylglycerophosphate synthase
VVGIGVGLPAGLAALTSMITALTVSVGLSFLGWLVGLVCGAVLALCVRLGLGRSGTTTLSPADLVTLVRALLACGVAALVADSFRTQPPVAAIVALSVLALVLDLVDGWVARRTRTSTAFGARFDGEVDAFLILVLSVYVAQLAGAWVLVLGLARYAFAVAGWLWAWMRRPLPYRYWRKVTAGVQGVVLTLAAADVVTPRAIMAMLLVALLLLAESFGRDVLWLWIRRASGPAGERTAVGRARKPGSLPARVR